MVTWKAFQLDSCSYRDMYLLQPRRSKPTMEKLATMVQGVAWHDSSHMLTALLDGKLSVWFYPRYRAGPFPLSTPSHSLVSACFLDRDVLPLTRFDKHNADLGSSPSLTDFASNFATVRRADGASIALAYGFHPLTMSNRSHCPSTAGCLRTLRCCIDLLLTRSGPRQCA